MGESESGRQQDEPEHSDTEPAPDDATAETVEPAPGRSEIGDSAVGDESGDDVPGGQGGRRTLRFTTRAVIVLASVVALGITAAGWTALDHLRNQVNSSDVLSDFPAAPLPDDGATDILLVGSDSRTDAQGDPLPRDVLKTLRTEATSGLNTDTLVLVRVPDDGSAATAVSIPRDTLAIVPGERPKKINSIYGLTKDATAERLRGEGVTDPEVVERRASLAGQRALVRAVQALSGVRVDHYAEVNLLGFYEVTKALGGVRVCLKNATSDKDSGADFPAGRQTISGADALAFVRQRHGLPRGDLDRIVRQQVFMAAVANKVLSTGTLTDPKKVNRLVAAAHKSVTLDKGWDVMGFVRQMQALASGEVRFVTLPITDSTARGPRGRSVVTVDEREVSAFLADLAHGPDSATRSPETRAPATRSPATPNEPSTPTTSGSATTPGEPTDRMAAEPLLELDGSALRADGARDPITVDGIPCVN